MKCWMAAVTAATAMAAGGQEPVPNPGPAARTTLTDGWFGLGQRLGPRGLTLDAGLTQVWQANTRGGRSTHRSAGRFAGSYDLEFGLDTEPLAGWAGGRVYGLAEGGWSEGVDASSVGSLFGVNDDASGDRPIDVTELWYEHSFPGDRVRVRIGKLDLTAGFDCEGAAGAFDGNAFANDETAQFLNSALVNNPAVPFPENGPGAAVQVRPASRVYLAAAVADAEADSREAGLHTAFHGRADFFAIVEAGAVSALSSSRGAMPGAYRVGAWHDRQPKDRLDGTGTRRGDAGVYFSADQAVFKENASDDGQGLGLFARLGFADGAVREIEAFWSAGVRAQGILPGRDDDVAAVGIAQGVLSDAAGFTASQETVVEVYYSIAVAGWLAVTPSIQWVRHPGGDRDTADAVLAGLRLQAAF